MARKKELSNQQPSGKAERKSQQYNGGKGAQVVTNQNSANKKNGGGSSGVVEGKNGAVPTGKKSPSPPISPGVAAAASSDHGSYFSANDKNFLAFRQQLARLGLEMKEIPGDGNCLFRALSDQLDGQAHNHHHYRMETVRYMIRYKDDFEPFIDMPFERYIDNLSRPGTYAGQDSLVAFARMKNVNIVIHQLGMPIWQIEGGANVKRELHISYHNGEHYCSVRRIGDLTATPADVQLLDLAVPWPAEADTAKPTVTTATTASSQSHSHFFCSDKPTTFTAVTPKCVPSSNANPVVTTVAVQKDAECNSVAPLELTEMDGDLLNLDSLVQFVCDASGVRDENMVREVLIDLGGSVEVALDHLKEVELNMAASQLEKSILSPVLAVEKEVVHQQRIEQQQTVPLPPPPSREKFEKKRHMSNRERKEWRRRQKQELAEKLANHQCKKGSLAQQNPQDSPPSTLNQAFDLLRL